MESTAQRWGQEKTEKEGWFELEDSSVVFKLRRSCERIEELIKEVQCLRKENELKNKIILNLQSKERELASTIQSLRQALECQSIEIRGHQQRHFLTEMQSGKKDDLQGELTRLKERYSNCEEENIILRGEIKNSQHEVFLLQQALKIRNAEFKQRSEEIDLLLKEKKALMEQAVLHTQLQQEFDSIRAINIQKDTEIEQQLAKYRRILSNYNMQLHDAETHEQHWQHLYLQLADTVDHIEDLRQAYRIRKTYK